MKHSQNPLMRELLPLSDFNDYYPFPTESQLRHWLFDGERNGFSRCVLRLGGRIWIDVEKLYRWMQEVNQRGGRLHER